MLFSRIITAFVALSIASVLRAENPPTLPDELADHEEYGIFTYYPSIPEALFLEGETIPPNHGIELRKALNELYKVTTIVLDSPGGDVYSALNMAGVIHDRSLNTYIPAVSNCASACSFMFFAGQSRFADGQLGVHQFAPTKDRQESRSTSIAQAQFTMSDLYAVLSPFDVPDFVIVKMFDTPADDMYYFTKRQLGAINKGNETVVLDQVDTLITAKEKFIAEFAAYLETSEQQKKQKTVGTEVTTKAPLLAPMKPDIPRSDPLLAEIQNLLNKHGCQAGVADGLLGDNTRSALRRFASASNITAVSFSDTPLLRIKDILATPPMDACRKQDSDLTPNKPNDPKLVTKIEAGILKKFSSTPSKTVKELQNVLNSHLCDAGSENGIMTIQTLEALQRFALRRNIPDINSTPLEELVYRLGRFGVYVCSGHIYPVGDDGNMAGIWRLKSACYTGEGKLTVNQPNRNQQGLVHFVKYSVGGSTGVDAEVYTGELIVRSGKSIEISLKPYLVMDQPKTIRMTGTVNRDRVTFFADISPQCKTHGSRF